MPSNTADPEVTARAEALVAMGLDARLAATAAASVKTFTAIQSALHTAGLTPDAPDPGKAALVHTAVTKLPLLVSAEARALLLAAIADARLPTAPHVEAAAAWLGRNARAHASATNAPPASSGAAPAAPAGPICVADFEAAAGVGVVVTNEQTVAAVDDALNGVRAELVEKRYRFNTGVLQRSVMETLRFADGKRVNALIRERVEALLGPKTEQDLAKPPKVKKTKPPKKKAQNSAAATANNADAPPEDPFASIPSRFEARGLSTAENTPELLEMHRRQTGGKVVTRFPPEPNGYLHIGHAKAMHMDFGYAAKMGGECILRFDDTNPTVEKTEYIEAILEMVEWMGYKPCRVTYSSDYFDQLYEYAEKLISLGKAYVCHQTGDEINEGRKEGIPSPYRDRSVEENLRLFRDMRSGKYAEGEATLRMKIDMQHVNLVMRDPVAYRILHVPHPHVGDKWCIYPSYDYTHCIIDSIENITHSLCTLEFEIRRDTYYWLLAQLNLYRPFVWESARLNLEYTVMSKRKLKLLVQDKHVRGWDDPRMPTLAGMRRRGYTAEAISKFCAAIGVSRNANMIGMHVLEHWLRTDHDQKAKRVLAVIDPLKVTIRNFRGEEALSVAYHPKDETFGRREVTLTKSVYIDRSDFRMEDEKGYYGLAPNKSAMLRYAYPVKVVEVVAGPDGKAAELIVEMDYEKSSKPKGVLHWVASSGVRFEARLYNSLFKSSDPTGLKGDWLDDIAIDSEVVAKDAIVEQSVRGSPVGTTFQFERTGYFTVDHDSTDELMVFNKTVSLRDSR